MKPVKIKIHNPPEQVFSRVHSKLSFRGSMTPWLQTTQTLLRGRRGRLLECGNLVCTLFSSHPLYEPYLPKKSDIFQLIR
jgi:hypothetical protein